MTLEDFVALMVGAVGGYYVVSHFLVTGKPV